jgi:hypothetical protein
MRIGIGVAVTAAVCAMGSYLAVAQQGPTPAEGFSFFITSAGPGDGANLGGLEGADRHCQMLAANVGTSGTWRAFLSTQTADGQPAINARDRITTAPIVNVQGVRVAADIGEFLSEASNLSKQTGLTELGGIVNGVGDRPNTHDIVTGSTLEGLAFSDGVDHTCSGYTSNAATGQVRVGHFDRMGGGQNPNSAISAHESRGCGQANLVATGGAGLFYCFRVDAPASVAMN